MIACPAWVAHPPRAGAVVDWGVRRRGRIFAIKWGMNPNSSSLGVDVTFLLVGATALAVITPVVGALLRWRRPIAVEPTPATDATAEPPAPPAG